MINFIKKLKNKKYLYIFSIILFILIVVTYLSSTFIKFNDDEKNLTSNQKILKNNTSKKYSNIKNSEKKLIIDRYIKQKEKLRLDKNSKLKSINKKNEVNLIEEKSYTISNSFVIIIDDAGMNINKLQNLLNLDFENLTIAFLPYSSNLDYQVDLVNKSGYDILVHIPMEPEDSSKDPGPNALLTSHNMEELRLHIEKNLSMFNNYVGINNHMGSKFTSDFQSIKNFFEIIKSKNIIFVDSKTTSNSLAADMSNEFNIPTLSRDVFIDNQHDKNYVINQLRKAEKVAKNKGYVVVIGHLQKWTIEALAEWYPEAKSNGLIFDTVSSIIKKKQLID